MTRTKRNILCWPVAFAGIAVAAFLPSLDCYGQTPCRYEIAHIIEGPWCVGVPPGLTTAEAISPNGRWIVGGWQCDAVGSYHPFAFDTTTGVLTTLAMPLGLIGLSVEDVNDSGIMVGTAETSASPYGYLYDIQRQQMIVEIPPGYPGPCRVTSINSTGAVCGYRRIAGPPTNPENAFIWSAETGVIDLGVMNGPRSRAAEITDHGLVVGWTGTPPSGPNLRAFTHRDGNTTVWEPVPGGDTSQAQAANEVGQIIITGSVGVPRNSVVRGFLVYNEKWSELRPLPGDIHSTALAISESGIAVGASSVSVNVRRACAWFVAQPVDLFQITNQTILYRFDLAVDISDDNRIVIWGPTTTGGSTHQVSALLAPIMPEIGDTNCDEIINVIDLLAVIGHWGPCQQCPTDLTQDGVVDLLDLLVVIGHWNERLA